MSATCNPFMAGKCIPFTLHVFAFEEIVLTTLIILLFYLSTAIHEVCCYSRYSRCFVNT